MVLLVSGLQTEQGARTQLFHSLNNLFTAGRVSGLIFIKLLEESLP